MEKRLGYYFVDTKGFYVTNKILRYLSDSHCEMYQQRRGKLHYISTGSLLDFSTENIKICVLGPRQFVVDEVTFDEGDFTPTSNTFLFSQETILPLDNLNYLPPYIVKNTQKWRQIWADQNKLEHLWETLPTLRKILPECICSFPPNDVQSWLADIAFEARFVEGQISYIHKDSLAHIPQTLDRFSFNQKLVGFRVNQNRVNSKMLIVMASCVAFLVPWLDVILGIPGLQKPQSHYIDNTLDLDPLFQSFGPVIAGTNLVQFEFNTTNKTISFNWDPADQNVLKIIPELKKMCQTWSCDLHDGYFQKYKRITITLGEK